MARDLEGLRLAAIAAASFVAACDPLVSVHATVILPPGAAGEYRGGYPAQVLVFDDQDSHQIDAPRHAWRVAVLCAAPDHTARFSYDRAGVGCASESHLVGYVAPLPPSHPAAALCGATATYVPPSDLPALPKEPWGRAVVFAGARGDCGDHTARTELLLRRPGGAP